MEGTLKGKVVTSIDNLLLRKSFKDCHQMRQVINFLLGSY